MSEQQQHNPEQQNLPQWFDTCNEEHCQTRYEITGNTAKYYYFDKQQDCNYLECQCPNCDKYSAIFDEDVKLGMVRLKGIEYDASQTTAPEEVYEAMCKVRGIELPKTYELTDRHEKLIKAFGETVCAVLNGNEELFWDEMNRPNSYRPYPIRWITD